MPATGTRDDDTRPSSNPMCDVSLLLVGTEADRYAGGSPPAVYASFGTADVGLPRRRPEMRFGPTDIGWLGQAPQRHGGGDGRLRLGVAR